MDRSSTITYLEFQKVEKVDESDREVSRLLESDHQPEKSIKYLIVLKY